MGRIEGLIAITFSQRQGGSRDIFSLQCPPRHQAERKIASPGNWPSLQWRPSGGFAFPSSSEREWLIYQRLAGR